MKKLRMIMAEKNLSSKELAKRLGVSQQTISNYRSGKNNPTLCRLQQIAEVLEVKTNELI